MTSGAFVCQNYPKEHSAVPKHAKHDSDAQKPPKQTFVGCGISFSQFLSFYWASASHFLSKVWFFVPKWVPTWCLGAKIGFDMVFGCQIGFQHGFLKQNGFQPHKNGFQPTQNGFQF